MVYLIEKIVIGMISILGFSLAIIIFDIPISFPVKWWFGIPSLLFGIIAGWLICFSFQLEKKYSLVVSWLVLPTIYCFILGFLSVLISDILFSEYFLTPFFLGAVLALASLSPDAIRKRKKRS